MSVDQNRRLLFRVNQEQRLADCKDRLQRLKQNEGYGKSFNQRLLHDVHAASACGLLRLPW